MIIPAIDIIDGKCVRLYRGSFDRVTVYGDDPVSIALAFAEAGARYIHVVDLDAARGSAGNNRELAARIKRETGCVVELGGGIRSERDIEEILALGVERLILGTVMVRNPEEVQGWVERYGRVFIAGIDARNGKVKVSGWEEDGGIGDVELASMARNMGIDRIIYTSISKDGVLEGPDIEATNRIAEVSGAKVVLSGGIGSEADIGDVYRIRKEGIVGTIVGKAIYEGLVDLERMIELFQESEEVGKVW